MSGESRSHPPLDETLIADIQAWMERFVVFPSRAHALIEAYFPVHTWTFDVANCTPYLYINGEQEAGKTRNMEILELLCRNSRRTTSISPPALYTLLRKYKAPTLLYDEIDRVWTRSSTANALTISILDAGYRAGGLVFRQRGDEVEEYETFGPKVLAGIHNGHLPSTILSRCIPIPMKPKRPDQKVERFIYHKVANSPEREELLARIEMFVQTWLVDISVQDPPLLGALSDRQNEIAEPLRQIAAVFGPDAARELDLALQTVFREQGTVKSAEAQVLARIRSAFEVLGTEVRGERRIFSDELCEGLGRGWRPKQLAVYLAQGHLARFGIAPELIRIGSESRRGYTDTQFAEAWAEHLGLRVVGNETEDESEVADAAV